MANLERWATYLDLAVMESREVDKITQTEPSLSMSDAYQIQKLGINKRLSRGEKIIGMKMGLTSKAKMKQMGVEKPIYGVLTSSMIVESGLSLSPRTLIHPKIEPEIAFIMGSDLKGNPSREEAQRAIEWVCGAMEVIDSRFKNFNFTLPDVVADNCSSTKFVLGVTKKKPSDLDLGNLGMVMEVTGQPNQFGSSAAIYGHPLDSLIELCRMMAESGESLKKGMIVLSGGATAAVELKPGSYAKTSVQDLGDVELQLENAK